MLSNLPDISDEFIGRTSELAHLSDALMRERLVTLVGVGGVGKSRPALHAAHAALRNRRRKVIWVELWPLRDGVRAKPAPLGRAGVRFRA